MEYVPINMVIVVHATARFAAESFWDRIAVFAFQLSESPSSIACA
jgi:hypothetical protein